MSMNAIEEIAKTQPKENAGPLTSKRYEYYMDKEHVHYRPLSKLAQDVVAIFRQT